MQKKHLGLAAIVLILVIAVGIFLKKGPAAVSGDPSLMGNTAGDGSSVEEGGAGDKFDRMDVSMLDKNADGTPKGSSVLQAPAQQINWTPQLKQSLKNFQRLQSKSVLTPQEEEERLRMLRDGELIHQISIVLRSRAAQADPQFEEHQNIAIDLLVEALKAGDEQAAIDAVWEQLRDNQVEDAALPLKQRQVLGGIKGELMYHATALRPDAFQDVEMDLPGPASQKIWKNVQNQHQTNLDSSQTEIDERQLSQPDPSSADD